MADRPYTLLSCGMSIDGYLDGARRAGCCCPTTPTSTGSTRCAPAATRSWSAPATVRNDNPRLLVRAAAPRRAPVARGLAAVAGQGHRHRGARELDPRSFFAAGGAEKLVYCASGRGRRGAQPARRRWRRSSTAGEPVDMRRVAEDLHARGVRRLMVEGGGTVHTQFLTRDLADELHLVVAPLFVGDSRARRFVGDGAVPVAPGHRATLAEIRQIGDVVLLRYALSSRFGGRCDRGGRIRSARRPPRSAREVRLPLRLPTASRRPPGVFTFDGLVDGREHLALGLGDRAGRASGRGPARRRWCGCTASA